MAMARLWPTSTTSASCHAGVELSGEHLVMLRHEPVELTTSIAHLSTEAISAACSLVDPRHRSKVAIAPRVNKSRAQNRLRAWKPKLFQAIYIEPGSVDERRSEKQEHSMFDDETQERIDRFMKVRVNEGLKIDPETAEVDFQWVDLVDPYGICPYDANSESCIGRCYFARAPGSDIWVAFYDLPKSTRDALWNKDLRSLAVPDLVF
jgi:hypothetical protein